MLRLIFFITVAFGFVVAAAPNARAGTCNVPQHLDCGPGFHCCLDPDGTFRGCCSGTCGAGPDGKIKGCCSGATPNFDSVLGQCVRASKPPISGPCKQRG